MTELTQSRGTARADFHNKLEGILGKIAVPTQELVENAFKEFRTYNSESIVPFTGYYSMSAAPGAFLSIDTVETYYQLSQKQVISMAAVTVTVSMDGRTSKTYKLDSSTSFDGQTLIIPNVLNIRLTRQYQDGVLVTFQGTINNVTVTGNTRFNPITLPTFIGDYYAATPSGLKRVLSIGDTTIAFDSGSGMNVIKYYTFTPLMFVLMFTDPATQNKYVLMMGTAGSMGLACYVQEGAGGMYAVTIPQPGS